ncbi:MAG: hypothetical protein P8163_08975 [Candidatus Thiodiazotropha sp.]
MPAFRLTAAGFDETETIFFRTTIEMASEYDLAEWLWVADRVADVILVNSDLKECTTKLKLDKPTEGKIRPILIYCSSSEETAPSDRYTLKKPIAYSAIITLLKKLEKELTNGDENASSLPEQKDKTGISPITSNYPLQIGSDRSETLSAVSPLPSSQPDNQNDSEMHVPIDEASDHDITTILMDSEFDASDSDISITTDAKPHYAANDQGNSPSGSTRAITGSKKPPLAKRHFEKQRFVGLIKKHLLSRIKRTGSI